MPGDALIFGYAKSRYVNTGGLVNEIDEISALR